MATFQEINFGPLARNVLDYIDAPNLTTVIGKPVSIRRSNGDFVITIGEQVHRTPDNIQVSYILNSAQVGETH